MATALVVTIVLVIGLAIAYWRQRQREIQIPTLFNKEVPPLEGAAALTRSLECQEVAASSGQYFAVIFELEFHPVVGRFPDATVRKRVYEIFGPEVEGGLDQYVLFKRLKTATEFTLSEREEIFKRLAGALGRL